MEPFLLQIKGVAIPCGTFLLATRSSWHATCNTWLPIWAVAERWLYCEPLGDARTLSVCESKQTVAAVWRSSPSRDTACFTQPGRKVPRRTLGGKAAEWSGRSTARVQLWERRLSGTARRTQIAADALPIPAIRLSSRMMLCIEPRPSLRTEDPVGYPRRANRVLYFCDNHFGGAGASGGDHHPDVSRRNNQSPNLGESCVTAKSSRARFGTTNSARRSSQARRIFPASQCGLIARNFAPPPGKCAATGTSGDCDG